MGPYIAFAFVVGMGYLTHLIARGSWRRIGARWWTALLVGPLAMIPFLLAVNAFTALGGDMMYARLVFFAILYHMATSYTKVKETQAQCQPAE